MEHHITVQMDNHTSTHMIARHDYKHAGVNAVFVINCEFRDMAGNKLGSKNFQHNFMTTRGELTLRALEELLIKEARIQTAEWKRDNEMERRFHSSQIDRGC